MGSFISLSYRRRMKLLLVLLSCLIVAAMAAPQTEKTRDVFTCTLCEQFMTAFDDFLTSEKTEDQIVEFVQQLCGVLGQIIVGFEDTCNFLIQSQLPHIIDGLVHDNLDPTQVCTDIMGVCP